MKLPTEEEFVAAYLSLKMTDDKEVARQVYRSLISPNQEDISKAVSEIVEQLPFCDKQAKR